MMLGGGQGERMQGCGKAHESQERIFRTRARVIEAQEQETDEPSPPGISRESLGRTRKLRPGGALRVAREVQRDGKKRGGGADLWHNKGQAHPGKGQASILAIASSLFCPAKNLLKT